MVTSNDMFSVLVISQIAFPSPQGIICLNIVFISITKISCHTRLKKQSQLVSAAYL